MDITTIIIAIISSGVINTILSALITAKQKKDDNNSNVQKALRLLMKDRLRYLCDHYITQGWIYEDELEDIIAMHSVYHTELNGNGYLDELMRRVKALDIRGVGVK